MAFTRINATITKQYEVEKGPYGSQTKDNFSVLDVGVWFERTSTEQRQYNGDVISIDAVSYSDNEDSITEDHIIEVEFDGEVSNWKIIEKKKLLGFKNAGRRRKRMELSLVKEFD